jgi:hypothetical protein
MEDGVAPGPSRSSILDPRFSILDSRSSILDSQSSVFDSPRRDFTARRVTRRRARKPPMVIAARPVTPAAFCVADDSAVVQSSPRTPAGLELRVFYSRPGRGLGLHFRGFRRKITTYERTRRCVKPTRRGAAPRRAARISLAAGAPRNRGNVRVCCRIALASRPPHYLHASNGQPVAAPCAFDGT